MEDTRTFQDLGVADDLVRTLEKRGITHPFPVQLLTIPDALAGHDVCGKAKTGSGKTLAFGLPVIERAEKCVPRRPKAIILVPTRELANQVSTELEPLAKNRALTMTTIYGGIAIARNQKALEKGVDIVVGTPGRMIDLMERRDMDLRDVNMVVIDEADHMADLGFLPQVDRLLKAIKGRHQTLLFSATLDGMVDVLVKRYMKDPVFMEVESDEANVENMEHRFIAVHPAEKLAAAKAICQSANRILVFVRTKYRCDRVAEQLNREGVTSLAIHGDLRQSQREQVLEDFKKGKLHVLVATNVAARGLHVEGVDLVLHYDAPDDPKTYIHRSGRTARAGEAGLVVTFVSAEHLATVKEMQDLAGLDYQIVAMKGDDPRLHDLANWDPPRKPKVEEKVMRKRRMGHRTTPGRGGRRRK